MLNFENLNILDKHISFLQKICHKDNIFLVWWSVRNILLNIDLNPDDIDFTTNWIPSQIYEKIDKIDLSHFITEKFGTITLLPKSGEFKKIKYELTPLRTESWYQDFRHPDEINRTSDLLLDSQRRDFTINCIYYTCTDIKLPENKKQEKIKDIEHFSKILWNYWFVYIVDQNLLILQNSEIISSLFHQSKLDKGKLTELINKNMSYFWNGDSIKKPLGIVIDPHNGINDILARQIKAVWNPDNRFGEDALRIVRAVRFLNILNQKLEKTSKSEKNYFNIDNDTWDSMLRNANLVENVAKERIKDEILKIFKNKNPFSFVVLLDKLDILKYIFPNVYQTKNVDQPIRYHPFDVYVHTILTLHAVQGLNKDYLVKLWILYHDVGKPEQYDYIASGLDREEIKKINWTDIHHPNIWEAKTKKDFQELGFSKKETDTVCFYVKNHMLIWEILKWSPENLDKKIKKLLSQYGYKMTKNLLDVVKADRLGHYNPVQPPALSDLKFFGKRLKEIYKLQWAFGLRDLAVNWNDIINEMNIKPWPQIKELLNKALEWVLEDVSSRNNKIDIIDFLKQG